MGTDLGVALRWRGRVCRCRYQERRHARQWHPRGLHARQCAALVSECARALHGSVPVGSGHVALQVDGNYLSRFWFNLSDLPVVEQPGFGVANVRANYTPGSGKYEIGVSLENLADKHYGTMGFDNTSINGLAQLYPGMPRWFKAHINYHF
jgi:outer membrane receptor protein involved in Fe transport